MEINQWKLKQEMCDIGHRIWLRGFCGGNEGNHSIRISEDRVICTPTGVSKGFLKPEMICTVDMKGNHIDKNNKYTPTSEVLIHLEIYKKREDIKAVIHSHPPHATAFALVGMPIPEGLHPEAEVFLGRVPFADFAMPSKMDLADSIVPLIKSDTSTVLMGNHGAVCFSNTLEDAYYRMEILDNYSKILLLTKGLGKPKTLTNSQMQELLEVKQSFGLKDERSSCAADGCANDQNAPFLASFDYAPSAVSNQNGEVVKKSSAPASNEMQFLVSQITDQIIKTLSNR
ncbi:MAG: class II aldolase/adducin family protein [Deltaproteobacteria bacterium]|jgi:L-fuculose-phosphate aldolase|nr:class II aldolase/adducin family protein [Deltaproteobacteria bacterium]MBT4527156.1 class II aldolase/adducin family protein [Deltaproteobacteria bacterium]